MNWDHDFEETHPADVVLHSLLRGLYANNEALPILIEGPFSLLRR